MKKSFKTLLIILAAIATLLLVIRFVGSPIAKMVIEKNSERWIGRQVEIGSLSVSALTGNVRIKDLRVTDENDTTTFASWDKLYVNISLIRLIGKHVYLRHIHLTDFDINVWNDGQRFNFSDLPRRFAPDDTTAVQDTTPSSWRISLNDIRLREGNISYEDKSRAQNWNFEHLRLDVPGLKFGAGQTDAGLRFELPDDAGSVTLRGAYNMQSNMYSLIADLKDIDLHFLLPVVQDQISAGGLDGWLEAHLVAHGSLDDVMGVQVQGNVNIESLELRDADKHTCAEIGKMALAVNNIVPKTMSMQFDSLVVDSMILNITRDKYGNTISKLLEAPEKPDSDSISQQPDTLQQSNEPASKQSVSPKLSIGKLLVRNSQVNYTDKTLFSKFNYKLRGIRISAQNLTMDGNNHIVLNSNMPGGGSMMLNWRGSLDYKKKDARVVAVLRNVQLEDLSPWTEYLFACSVNKGILSLTSDNTLHAGIIDGMQKIEIIDFKLGRRQNRLDAEFKSVPLKSAIALMTDLSGKILIEVPVQGDLSEPKFSLGKVIGRAIGNTLLKATAAPFVAMAQAQNIPISDLNQMQVDLIQPDLSLEQYKKLDIFAKMMQEQPNVTLKMIQQFNLKNAIEEQAVFNVKKAFYEQNNHDAIGSLTLLDIEKIKKINNSDPQLKVFADNLLGKRGTLTNRAVNYYTADSLEIQVMQGAAQRNEVLIRYLTKQQNIKEKRLSIITDEKDNLEKYKGQNRYEVISEMEDLE